MRAGRRGPQSDRSHSAAMGSARRSRLLAADTGVRKPRPPRPAEGGAPARGLHAATAPQLADDRTSTKLKNAPTTGADVSPKTTWCPQHSASGPQRGVTSRRREGCGRRWTATGALRSRRRAGPPAAAPQDVGELPPDPAVPVPVTPGRESRTRAGTHGHSGPGHTSRDCKQPRDHRDHRGSRLSHSHKGDQRA